MINPGIYAGVENTRLCMGFNTQLKHLPPAVYFILDKKVGKNQSPIEICLSRFRNFGKKYIS
jgi:hypothetical protein